MISSIYLVFVFPVCLHFCVPEEDGADFLCVYIFVFQRKMGVIEERRSLADGEEDEDEEEEEEDMSPQKLRTMIKEGIEVTI